MLLKNISKVTVAVAIASLLCGAAWGQEQQKSPWKDRAEYDMYNTIAKEADAAKQVQLLDTYMEKYPESNFKEQVYLMYTLGYQKLGQADKMYESALEILKLNPKNIQGMYFVTSLTTSMGKTDAEHLSNGEKYGKALLSELNGLQKPATLSDAQWKTQTDSLGITAHTTLGWVAMNNKNNAEAERHFRDVLKLNGENGQVSFWLGTVIIAQRDPAKQAEAFFHFARASSYTGTGAMSDSGRQQVASYLEKIYTSFHGDESGLDEMKEMAKSQVFPPSGFSVKSKEQIAFEKEEQLKRENPKLALWLSIKENLLGPNGAAYFDGQVKNTAMPSLRGYLVGQSPEQRPDTLVLGLSSRGTREVTLKLDQAFKYPAGGGTVLNFSCVPRTFSAQPFNLSFECDHTKVSGWPPPPSRQTTR